MKQDFPSKDVETMSDAALAAFLIREVAGPRGHDDSIKELLNRAYRALQKQNEAWKHRRVRAIWNREAARIEHREIAEMKAAIALREARKEHAEYIAETERLAALGFAIDPDFYRDQIEARRSILGGVGRSGADGGAK